MAKIEKHTGENIGGMLPVWWAFASDISTQLIDRFTLRTTVTLVDGAKWSSMYSTPDTIELDSEESEKPAGTQYTYKMKCLIPQDRSDVELVLRRLANRGLIIWTKDKNGIIRIIGTKENPMKKVGKLKKPATVEGFNGWEITFTGDFSLPAFYGDELDDSVKSTE
jgi:G3E family GTPase